MSRFESSGAAQAAMRRLCRGRDRGSLDERLRHDTIKHFEYLVKTTAARLLPRLEWGLREQVREDLWRTGLTGLIKAVDTFDPGRGVKFETFAIALIRGACLEHLRETDWVPRLDRKLLRDYEHAARRLELATGVCPTEEEVFAHLGMGEKERSRVRRVQESATLSSLDEVTPMLGDGLSLMDVIQDPNADTEGEATRTVRHEALLRYMDRLPARERVVVERYYYGASTFKQIGEEMKISESRVYQLHTAAVLRLRGYLQSQHELFAA